MPEKDVRVDVIRTSAGESCMLAIMVNEINMEEKDVKCGADKEDLEAIAGDWAIDFDFSEEKVPGLVQQMRQALTDAAALPTPVPKTAS